MLTVLMATYNGAKTLPDVLDAYSRLESPEGGWKLTIVNNGSTDHTKEVITSFSQRLPLTYLFEATQGKNVSLNTGLSNVSGDLVVFTDDDALPELNWLKEMRAAADSQPSYSIFGGPVLPHWEIPPETWILEWVPLSPTFAILYPAEEGPINPRLIFGPNMAIRARIFEKGYRFNENRGPKGPNYAMGSETEFNLRLAKAGFKAWHCKGAIVHHMIRSFQMTQDWVLNRAIRYGRAQHLRELSDSHKSPVLLLKMRWSLPLQTLAQRLRVSCARWSGNAEKTFKGRWKLNFLIGRALEASLKRSVN